MLFTDSSGNLIEVERKIYADYSRSYRGYDGMEYTLTSSDGNTITVTETTNGDYYYRDDNGTGFSDHGDGTWTDENGIDYTEIN